MASAGPKVAGTPGAPFEAALLGAGEADHAFQDAPVSQEEIELFTVSEGLSDLERAQLYIGSGQAVQELAVVQNLPGLVRAAGRPAWTAISRSLAEVAKRLDAAGQLFAAEAFAALARERLLPPVDITDVILPLVLAGACDGSQLAVQAAWLACLADIAAAIELGTLHSRVLPAVVQRGSGGGKAVRERCLCCQLLGAVAPHAAAEDVRSLARLANTLCQDTEWQVRNALCQQLPGLAAAAADKLDAAALAAVLEDVFGLLEDEETLVRAGAWRALAAVVDLLPLELRRQRALPRLLQECREPEHHAEVHRSLTAGFGDLMGRLVADMDGDAEVAACLTCYRGLAWRHDHATRLNCAAAFPAVLKASTARRYGSHLHDTLLRLASDADAEVRQAVAAGLPEVAAALGRERCAQYLRQPVAALLQDERQEVQLALLQQLQQLFQHFSSPAEDHRLQTFTPLVEPLLRLEAVSGYSWRLQQALLHAMAAFPAFFSPDQLYDRFLPLALKYMADGVAALREAAAAAAAAIWRALRKAAHRTALYSRLIHDFAQDKCFRHRMAFLTFCRHAQRHFSSKFVKAQLLEPALTLAYDPIANVRLHLASVMPALKQSVALPYDVHLLERLNSGMSHLITDGDTDVCQAARKAYEEFKRLAVRMSCGALESSSAEVKAFEAEDAGRAEAERDYLFDTDQLEKIRADIASYDELRRPANARLALSLPAHRGDAAGSSSGTSSRLGSSRSGSGSGGGRGGVRPAGAAAGGAAKGRALAAAVTAGGHQRSNSDASDGSRGKGKGLLKSVQGRSASVDGQRTPGAGAGASGSNGGGSSGSSAAAGTASSRLAVKTRGAAAAVATGGSSSSSEAAAPQEAASTAADTDGAAGVQAGTLPAAAAQLRPPAAAVVSGAGQLARHSPNGATKAAAPTSRLSRPSLTGKMPGLGHAPAGVLAAGLSCDGVSGSAAAGGGGSSSGGGILRRPVAGSSRPAPKGVAAAAVTGRGAAAAAAAAVSPVVVSHPQRSSHDGTSAGGHRLVADGCRASPATSSSSSSSAGARIARPTAGSSRISLQHGGSR